MAEAKPGDRVKIHYHGTFDDGTVFDSTRAKKKKEPFEIALFGNNAIPGLEKAIIGMSEGETKKIRLEPEEAFGARNEELVVEVDKSHVEEHIKYPQTGMMLRIRDKDGQANNVTIVEIADDKITLDGNHPLAGKTLNFEIEVVEIVAATA